LREGACYVLLNLVVLWNIATLPQLSWSVPEPIRQVSLFLRLDQYWGMFAPRPARAENWYVIRGVLQDGEVVDVYRLRSGEPLWKKPADNYEFYASRRWRKFLEKLPQPEFEFLRLHYGRYLCQRWNEQAGPGKRLATFEIGVLQELNQPDYAPAQFSRAVIWYHDCQAK